MYFQKIGDGDNIVFLHGWGCSGDIFLPIAENLTRFSCYLVDFNGFGKSAFPPVEGWSVEDYADKLFEFFKDNRLSDATLVAHSFGCRVALFFAAKYPFCVRKMMLIAPAGVREFSLARSLKVFRYKLRKCMLRLGCLRFALDKFGSNDYLLCDVRLKNTFVKVVNQDLRKYAKAVVAPTILICGRDDLETPLKHAKLLNKCIPNSELVEISGGHFAFFVNSAAFASAIMYFEGKSL